jgi:hypothetical protein
MGNATPDPVVGYFVHLREASTFWGALLLLNDEADPVDLVTTEPVSLGAVHALLLGPRAEGHVLARVLLPPLLKQAGTRPGLILFDTPVVLLRRLDLPVALGVLAPSDAAHMPDWWTWVEHSGVWVPSHGSDAALVAIENLAKVMRPFTLDEPFSRLRAAVGELRKPVPAR